MSAPILAFRTAPKHDEHADSEPTESQVDPRFAELPLFMSPAALAAVLDVTVNTLERWRRTKTGPAWKKFPGSNLIRYTRASVIEWIDSLEGSEGES